ncbi:hypothetical protein DESUT3_40420 [Desulfuromonas versatilis]|uniref:Carboxypeptidase regulatory-like domain-containing protein n=1 Tax=Desulfuromonas versatilis TaxID=2802975 RepID=A0ABN6E3T5_9BACT|nr:carboxypeptidase-like regulatory domain-containing protein [Desulfuromonas versatilis]BCR06973.1 hypothetical protein DESUT3_40420 [Desulfuromonas versatilis]
MGNLVGKNWLGGLLLVLGFWWVGGCARISAPELVLPEASSATGIAGTVSDREGAPAVGAFVYAYRSARGGLRGPADFEASVDEDGRYFLDLVEGRYYLVARSRHGAAIVGPPRPGDAWALFAHNPVEVRPGRTSRADFVLQGISQPMLMREGTLTSGTTGFAGRVVDDSGKPATGAFAMAYRDADFRRMPDFTSPAVGEDGRFVLYVPEPGRYCLAVRTRTRGQPMAGELYGTLGEGEAGCRRVGEGELLEVGTIVVRPYRR